MTTLIVSSILGSTSNAQQGPGNPPPQGGANAGNPPPPSSGPRNPPTNQETQAGEADVLLQLLIEQQNLNAINPDEIDVLDINEGKAQLGKKLFFTKNLGGEQSAACVSCHHPSLGGSDDLSLSVGVSAVNSGDEQSHDLLGHGRFNGLEANNLPAVPRNAPTIFNLALYERGLFWDSRVERNRQGDILTPDSEVNDRGRRRPDRSLPQDTTLAAAQAKFPVTSKEEMRGEFASNVDNQSLRSALVSRLNNQIENIATTWPTEFSQVFGDDNVSIDRVFDAIGEYERSMVFVNNAWTNYLSGNNNALTEQQKQGAILFFTSRQEGGAGCVGCHSGSNFTNERHHLTAFPQIGVGKGNDSLTSTSQDFGRENVTNDIEERFHFRTPSLLNIEVSAPYGHSGAYQTLEEVVAHYNSPRVAIDRLFSAQAGQPQLDNTAPYCQLPQIAGLMIKNNQNCEDIFPDAYRNSIEVVSYLDQANAGVVASRNPLRPRRPLSPEQVSQVADFLRALTDPCVESRDCLAPWIIDENDVASFPDDQPLVATDENGLAL